MRCLLHIRITFCPEPRKRDGKRQEVLLVEKYQLWKHLLGFMVKRNSLGLINWAWVNVTVQIPNILCIQNVFLDVEFNFYENLFQSKIPKSVVFSHPVAQPGEVQKGICTPSQNCYVLDRMEFLYFICKSIQILELFRQKC